MEDEGHKWGNRKDEFYADDKERSESDGEDDEYNEIMKLEKIRAQKMKLIQVPKVEGNNSLLTFQRHNSSLTKWKNERPKKIAAPFS